MVKILILGHINSGKTTAAQYLSQKYNLSVGSLGTNVKKFYVNLFDVLNGIDSKFEKINYNSLFDRETKEQHRKYLQDLSNKLVKPMFGDDIWLKMTENYDIIEDIRFKHEYDYYISKNNSNNLNKIYTIRIKRNLEISNNDISEHDMDSFKTDFEINNNNDLISFYNELDKIMKIIGY